MYVCSPLRYMKQYRSIFLLTHTHIIIFSYLINKRDCRQKHGQIIIDLPPSLMVWKGSAVNINDSFIDHH